VSGFRNAQFALDFISKLLPGRRTRKQHDFIRLLWRVSRNVVHLGQLERLREQVHNRIDSTKYNLTRKGNVRVKQFSQQIPRFFMHDRVVLIKQLYIAQDDNWPGAAGELLVNHE
jgi:hypothetical protein